MKTGIEIRKAQGRPANRGERIRRFVVHLHVILERRIFIPTSHYQHPIVPGTYGGRIPSHLVHVAGGLRPGLCHRVELKTLVRSLPWPKPASAYHEKISVGKEAMPAAGRRIIRI